MTECAACCYPAVPSCRPQDIDRMVSGQAFQRVGRAERRGVRPLAPEAGGEALVLLAQEFVDRQPIAAGEKVQLARVGCPCGFR